MVALTGTEPPHRATHWTGHTLEREVATSRAIPVVLNKLRAPIGIPKYCPVW